MRFFLLLACCAISLNTSAQFWKKKVRYVAMQPAISTPAPQFITPAVGVKSNAVYTHIYIRPLFNFDEMERSMLKEAKHNMRFREYQLASRNFTDLAGLYLLHNRYSEAKWYLLQSISLTHDVKLKVSNYLSLAAIKSDLGEALLAKADLHEARALANANGFNVDVVEIEKRIVALNNSKAPVIKPELRYSDAVEAAARKKAALKAL